MRIAVYTIALNEEKFAQRFLDSCAGADLILVGDTGSTDKTQQILEAGGAYVAAVHQKPWRFDIPRNSVLSLVPSDIDLCIALDLDELLTKGWRDIIEKNWKPGEHNRLRFRYVHNFGADDSYGTVGLKDFAHARDNYLWRHCVHEQLYYVGPGAEKVCQLEELVVEHRQDHTKPRSSYLPLLEQESKEPTATPRHIFWLGREYTYHSRWKDAETALLRYLDIPNTWIIERSTAMQLIAKVMADMGCQSEAKKWHVRATEESPKQREPWMALAWFHYTVHEWAMAYDAVIKAITITAKPEHYLVRPDCWNDRPYDLGALCAFKLGNQSKAQELIKIALKMNPTSDRLKHSAKVVGLTT